MANLATKSFMQSISEGGLIRELIACVFSNFIKEKISGKPIDTMCAIADVVSLVAYSAIVNGKSVGLAKGAFGNIEYRTNDPRFATAAAVTCGGMIGFELLKKSRFLGKKATHVEHKEPVSLLSQDNSENLFKLAEESVGSLSNSEIKDELRAALHKVSEEMKKNKDVLKAVQKVSEAAKAPLLNGVSYQHKL